MRSIIIGAGQMGIAAAHAMKILGFDTTIVGLSEEDLSKAIAKLGEGFTYIPLGELRGSNYDVCISAAPFHANLKWAAWCKERNIPYCDLGGNHDISTRIKEQFKHFNPETPVFTDLGLAPGLANIIAERLWLEQSKRAPVKGVFLRVGGLPEHSLNNTLNYSLVFSIEGLKNEYSGKCFTLKDGNVVQVDALSGLKSIRLFGKEYEIFHTSGGLSHTLDAMRARGVQELDYKTIRYPGHCHIVKFLLNECRVDDETFGKLLANACPPVKNDKVLIKVGATSNLFGSMHNEAVVTEMEILGNSDWTAMQQATAFPTAVTASLMATKRFKFPVVEYADVPFDEFSTLLNNFFGLDISKMSIYDEY